MRKTPPFSYHQPQPSKIKLEPFKIRVSSPSTTHESLILDNNNHDLDNNKKVKKKLRVVVMPMEGPRLVLKFVWMEKNIGIALDQVIAGGHGTVPLSPYYFWPRKDAWEELKIFLESKPWISQKQMVVLLNQATDIINLWQQSGGNLS
ncbi:small ribosomal subunit protein cS23-like [Primulina eburnea]|uniref:small ribosomal subunit protein cS23-like n=1 Tax=Primulina eburnea TaxID=1245227 RepID=UPI003C6C2704